MHRVSVAALASALSTVLSLSPACAEEPVASSSLGVREIAAEVLRANPALRAAGAEIDAARGDLTQAGLWPNPEADAEWVEGSILGSQGDRSGRLGFSQPVPIAGRIERARAVARSDVRIAKRDSDLLALQLVAEAQSTAVSVLALERAIAARDEVLKATQELSHISVRRFQAAETSEADVNLLAIEVSSLEQERELLRLERAAALFTLNRLLNRPPDSALEIKDSLDASLLADPSVESLTAKALVARPDLRRLRSEAARARAEARLARAEVWEDWSVGAAYQRENSAIDSANLVLKDRDNLLALSLRIPLPLWNRNQGRVASALARERSTEARLAAAEQAARAEVASAAQRTARLRVLAETFQIDALGRARRNVELLRRGYAQGLTPISDVVQGQRQLAETSARLAETLGALRRAEVDLEAAAAASPLLQSMQEEESRQ